MASQRLLIGFCSKSAAVADTVMVTKSTIMMPATTMWTMCGIVKHWTSGNAAMVYGAPLNQLQLSATRKTAQNLDGPDDWEALLLEAVANPHTEPNRNQQKDRNRVHDAKVESIALDDDRVDEVDVCNHLPDPASMGNDWVRFSISIKNALHIQLFPPACISLQPRSMGTWNCTQMHTALNVLLQQGVHYF
eukprot:351455-Chlamydomonas_euryale.AAC.5